MGVHPGDPTAKQGLPRIRYRHLSKKSDTKSLPLKDAGCSQQATAAKLGWPASSISSERNRNRVFDAYQPQVAGLHFRLTDWLGTLRATTDSAGVVESTCSSQPFGDAQACNGPTDTHHFTGKEHDNESGNDYFGARYYSSGLARWMSPDWSAKVEPVPYAKLDDPQTLNLYAYVGNKPLTGIDPDGHVDPCQAGACGFGLGMKLLNLFYNWAHPGQQQNQQQNHQQGRGFTTPPDYHPVLITNGASYEVTPHLCGDGECVAYVKEAGGFGNRTAEWKAGPRALDLMNSGLQPGTVLMLADKDGHYPTGASAKHALEFEAFTADGGMRVRD